MLINTLSSLSLQEVKSNSIEYYIKGLMETGHFVNRREVIIYMRGALLDNLIEREEYEKCAWLKKELDKLKK